MPVRDTISAPTAACLETLTDGPVDVLTEIGLPVDEARNRLSARALALVPRPQVVIWVDSDAVWTARTFDLLREDVRRLGPCALIGVIHGPRAAFSHPHVFIDTKPPVGTPLQWGIDYPRPSEDSNRLRRVTFLGAHMLAHDVRLLELLGHEPWRTDPALYPSEDAAFCIRTLRAGGSVWCDTSVAVVHFDEETGLGYLPGFVNPLVVYPDGSFVSADDSVAQAAARVSTSRSYGSAVDSAMEYNMRSPEPADRP